MVGCGVYAAGISLLYRHVSECLSTCHADSLASDGHRTNYSTISSPLQKLMENGYDHPASFTNAKRWFANSSLIVDMLFTQQEKLRQEIVRQLHLHGSGRSFTSHR